MSNITKVIAYVDLDNDATHGEQYGMNVSVAARLDDGREIAGDVFGFAGPRDGLGAIWPRYRGPLLHEDPAEHDRLLKESYHVGMDDVQDAINQMLGRDPEMHPAAASVLGEASARARRSGQCRPTGPGDYWDRLASSQSRSRSVAPATTTEEQLAGEPADGRLGHRLVPMKRVTVPAVSNPSRR